MIKDSKKVKLSGSEIKKQIHTSVNPDSSATETPIWSFSKCDSDCENWCIGRAMDHDSFWNQIIARLNCYETMTWAQIEAATGAKSHGNMNHFVSIDRLTPEAEKRFRELDIPEDSLYTLNLQGSHKLIGIRSNRRFYLVWYDPNHEVVKQEKKH
jgi:hypothetical protein